MAENNIPNGDKPDAQEKEQLVEKSKKNLFASKKLIIIIVIVLAALGGAYYTYNYLTQVVEPEEIVEEDLVPDETSGDTVEVEDEFPVEGDTAFMSDDSADTLVSEPIGEEYQDEYEESGYTEGTSDEPDDALSKITQAELAERFKKTKADAVNLFSTFEKMKGPGGESFIYMIENVVTNIPGEVSTDASRYVKMSIGIEVENEGESAWLEARQAQIRALMIDILMQYTLSDWDNLNLKDSEGMTRKDKLQMQMLNKLQEIAPVVDNIKKKVYNVYISLLLIS